MFKYAENNQSNITTERQSNLKQESFYGKLILKSSLKDCSQSLLQSKIMMILKQVANLLTKHLLAIPNTSTTQLLHKNNCNSTKEGRCCNIRHKDHNQMHYDELP